MALICSLVQQCMTSRVLPTMAWLLMARQHPSMGHVERLLIWPWDNWNYQAIISEKNPRRPSRYRSGSVFRQTGLIWMTFDFCIIGTIAILALYESTVGCDNSMWNMKSIDWPLLRYLYCAVEFLVALHCWHYIARQLHNLQYITDVCFRFFVVVFFGITINYVL